MCETRVSYWIPKGGSHKEYFVRCGNTDPYGGRAVCDECEDRHGERIAAEERAIAADNAASHSAGWGDW